MSFEAPALLDRLTALSCILTLGEGGKLSVRGCVLTDEMQSEIRAHKPELIALLQAEDLREHF